MFIYSQWEEFCKKLKDNGITSISAASAQKIKQDRSFLILKHDVETNPSKALKLAQIENKYSHKSSFYVQAYLLNSKKNINILKMIQELGHEVSYHHDVMDSNKGNIEKATKEFQKNLDLFEEHGFPIETVCQHGNPVIEREGYSSNRDFFRDVKTAEIYESISEIMVNFRKRVNVDYKYISDAGYGWKIIFDPENNDVIDSSEMDENLENLDEVIKVINERKAVIISTHPHRWNRNIINARVRNMSFKYIKTIAKLIMKIPFMKKILGRFYYLAKKI